MNNKALYVLLTICGLILSALVVRNGRLLLLAIPFLVYLLLGIVQAPGEIALFAHRTIDKRSVVAQEQIQTHIVIENRGKTLINLYLDDPSPPSMTVLDGQVQQRLSLTAGEGTELNYIFRAERGLYSWTAIHARAADPFGLFEVEQELPAFGEILVRPLPMQLRHVPLKPRFTLHAPGPISTQLAGSGIGFLGIRDYRPGDSLRRLNWRLAARHPHKLFTNEYEREEITDFGLILDARRLTNTDAMEEALFENSIRVTASLSELFLKEGNRVALLVFGKTMASLFPGYGKKQLNLIMRNLALARLGSSFPFEYLEYFPGRLFPSRSILVVLSAVGSRDLETYARLRAFGYDVLLISPDPVDYVRQMLPPARVNNLAARAARVERLIQLKQLMKLGVKVIDWQVNEPFETVVQKAAGYLAHRRNL